MDRRMVEEGKSIAIISYLTIFGVIIAFYMNNEKKNPFAAFHFRQSLGLWLGFFGLGLIISNLDSWMASIALYIAFAVLFFYGFIAAIGGKAVPVPLVGNLFQKIFSGLGK